MSIDAPGGPFGYLRVYGFDSQPGPFIDELIRLIPLLPDRGLIIDIRGNPGGYIWAAELALQLFTPNRSSRRSSPRWRRRSRVGSRRSARCRGPGTVEASLERRSATASCTRRPSPSPIQTPAMRWGRCTAGRWCWSPIRRRIRRATSSRRGSSTTRWGPSSASVPRPVRAVPTSGPTASCDRRSPAHRRPCRRCPMASTCRSHSGVRPAPASTKASRLRMWASRGRRTR